MKATQLLLRYLIFIGIPYLLAKRIEKVFYKHADPKLKEKINKELKDLPELDTISEPSKYVLDKRGGFADSVILWLTKVVIVDLPIKVAIAGAVGASIWAETA